MVARLAEFVAESLECLARGHRRGFGVDLHRDGNAAVPENLHRYSRVYVECGEQRPARLARAVHGDPAHSRLGNPVVETAVEIPRLDRRSVARSEYQAGVFPPPDVCVVFTVLLFLAALDA